MLLKINCWLGLWSFLLIKLVKSDANFQKPFLTAKYNDQYQFKPVKYYADDHSKDSSESDWIPQSIPLRNVPTQSKRSYYINNEPATITGRSIATNKPTVYVYPISKRLLKVEEKNSFIENVVKVMNKTVDTGIIKNIKSIGDLKSNSTDLVAKNSSMNSLAVLQPEEHLSPLDYLMEILYDWVLGDDDEEGKLILLLVIY